MITTSRFVKLASSGRPVTTYIPTVLYITVCECDTAALFYADVTSPYFSITRLHHVLFHAFSVFPCLRYKFPAGRSPLGRKRIAVTLCITVSMNE